MILGIKVRVFTFVFSWTENSSTVQNAELEFLVLNPLVAACTLSRLHTLSSTCKCCCLCLSIKMEYRDRPCACLVPLDKKCQTILSSGRAHAILHRMCIQQVSEFQLKFRLLSGSRQVAGGWGHRLLCKGARPLEEKFGEGHSTWQHQG